jgi:long-chain acyl-CoA synthetase
MRNANGESIAGAVLARARATGSRTALRTSLATWTGTELVDATVGIAAALGDRRPVSSLPLIIVMRGDPATVAALLAADLAGRTAVLLPSTSTEEQIRWAATASCADLLLQSDIGPIQLGDQNEWIDHAHGLCWTDLPSIEVRASGAADQPEQAGFLCHLTSGTMGRAKLALRTRAAVRAEIDVLRRTLSLTHGDVALCTSAVSHSYGCIGGMLTPLLVGATVMLARNPDEMRASLLEADPSIVFGLGPIYAELLQDRSDLERHWRDVRFAFSAGAPLPAGLFERFLARFGVPIRQDYGTSESGTISLDLAAMPQLRSVGEPLPHTRVRLRPPMNIPLEPGEGGEILVRSPALARGYLAGGTLSPCTDEFGWYNTQDAGSWVSGSLFVSRRLRPLITINGERVSLDQVERAIQDMPGVTEVVVSPGTDLGRTVLVAGVAGYIRSPEEVRTWCLQRLPRNWVPDRIAVFDRLPRSPAGKIVNRYI